MPGGPLVIVTHRGRRSGRTYRTPIEVIVEDKESGEILLLPARAKKGDWYRNILAGGLVEIRLHGESSAAGWRELSEKENGAALERYLAGHPRWGRMILKGLARRHRLEGDLVSAVAKAMPILALRTIARSA